MCVTVNVRTRLPCEAECVVEDRLGRCDAYSALHQLQTKSLVQRNMSGKGTDATADGVVDSGYHPTFYHEAGDLIEGGISLRIPAPSLSLTSHLSEIFEKCSKERLVNERGFSNFLFQYGSSKGDTLYRVQLAKFLSQEYNSPVQPQDIMCTAGSTIGILLLSVTYFESNDLVFMENPAYYGGIDIFNDLNRKIVHVDLDQDGIRPDLLEQSILEHYPKNGFKPSDKKPFWAMVYLVPVYHNPTSACLSEERSKRIVKLARKYHLLILCDDVYNLLSLKLTPDGTSFHPPSKRLYEFDHRDDADFFGNVISNGSFSKIVSPGLRLGWMEGPPHILDKLRQGGIIQSGGALNHVMSGLVAQVLASGSLHTFTNTMRKSLKEKLDGAVEILNEELQGAVKFHVPEGGFYLWIELPDGIDAAKFEKFSIENYKIDFIPGSIFSSNQETFKSFVRMSFSFNEKENFLKAIQLFCQALKSYRGK